MYHLLVKDNSSNLSRNIGIRRKIANMARLRITLKNNNSLVSLHADSNAGSGLVDGEMARELAARGNVLDNGELARGAVNLEVDEGVGVDLLVLVVEAGDLVDVFTAR
jgi:hypothetical protein